MIYTYIHKTTDSLRFLENRIILNGVDAWSPPINNPKECRKYDVQSAISECSNRRVQIKNNIKQCQERAIQKDKACQNALQDNVVRMHNYRSAMQDSIEAGTLPFVGGGAGAVVKLSKAAQAVQKVNTASRFIKKIVKRPKAIKRAKNIKKIRTEKLARIHKERYTVEGIVERIEKEGLKIVKGGFDRRTGHTEYFLSGVTGVLRSVKIRKQNGAISMWVPRSVKGKGYTTALYVAISRKFKMPIIMSNHTTSNIIDDAGKIIQRGGKYIWEELKKTGRTYIKDGRTYFDAN